MKRVYILLAFFTLLVTNSVSIMLSAQQALSDELPFMQEAYLKASNAEENDSFGYSMAMDGNTLVVGAYEEDSSAVGINGEQEDDSLRRSGAVYVFLRDGSTWSQQTYIKASNPGVGDRFGWSVAISGDTLVVGTYAEASSTTEIDGEQDDNSAPSAGAAYVFVRDGSTWSQQAYLKPSNTEAGDSFGNSVAVEGDTIVVGAPLEDSSASGIAGDPQDNSRSDSGAAYVFVRDGEIWNQEVYLKAANPNEGDRFGHSVSIDNSTIVIGAWGVNSGEDDNSMDDAGAAYVYVGDGTSWTQTAELKASNPIINGNFGWAVDINENTVAVGAPGEVSMEGIACGAVYVFARSGSTWSEDSHLTSSNIETCGNLGNSVSVTENTIVAGSPLEESSAIGVNGDASLCCTSGAGAVYVYTFNDTTWSELAYLKASNTGVNDQFGFSVAVENESIVIGAWGEDSNATGINGDEDNNLKIASGAVYVFSRPGEESGVDEDDGNVDSVLVDLPVVSDGNLSFDTAATSVLGEIMTVDLAFEIPDTDCPALDTRNQIEVMLVMDVSGSMLGTRLAVAKSAALRFLNQLDPSSTDVGLVRFANRASVLNNLSPNYIVVDDNINNLVAGGATNIASGLQQAANVLNRNGSSNTRRIIQLLSDGESNIGNEVATARQIRSQGIEIFAVGFGDANATTLREVSSEGNYFLFSETNQELNAAFYQTGQGIASNNQITGSNIIIRMAVDTENFQVLSDLTLDGVVEDGIVTWEIPVIYQGQSIQRSLVVVPLNEGAFSLGDVEITYDTCLDGERVRSNTVASTDVNVVTTVASAEQSNSNILNTATKATSELEVLGTDRWLLDVSDVNLISVVVTGAGSELVPDLLVNESLSISPLYSVREIESDRRSSVYYVGDIDAAWLYVQSNSRADVGVYDLNITDTASGSSIPLQLNADGIIETQTEFEGRLYDLQGNLSDGDFVTVRYEFGFTPQVEIASLTSGLRAESQLAFRADRNTIAYVFQLRGEPPYRMMIASESQYRISVQAGDSFQTQRGEFSVNQPAFSPGSEKEMDRWTIDLEADQPYIISLPGAAGRGIYYEIAEVNDDGTSYLADNIWNGGYHDEIGPFVLSESGTYALFILAGRDYQVSVVETTLSQTEPQTIRPEQTVSGETIAGTDGLQWTFEGRADQFLKIVLDPSRSDVSWLEMSLATSDGVDVAFSDDDGSLVTIGPVLLTEDDTYVITVAPRFFINAMFDMSLSLVDIGGASSIMTGRGGNLRSGPGTNFGVVGGVEANETLFAIGAVPSGDWIRAVTYEGNAGWLFAQVLDNPDVVTQLPIVDADGNVVGGTTQLLATPSNRSDEDTSSPDTAPIGDAEEIAGIRSSPSGTFSFGLPARWTMAEAISGEVTIQEATTNNLYVGFLAPFALYRSQLDPNSSVDAIFDGTLAGNNGAAIGGRRTLEFPLGAAIRQDYTVRGQNGILIAIDTGDDGYMLFYAQGTPATLATVEPTLYAILQTLNYDSTAASEAAGEIACTISVESNVNLRGGPGTDFDTVSRLSANTQAAVDSRTVDAAGYTWWKLSDDSGWVRSDVVNEIGECNRVPIVESE